MSRGKTPTGNSAGRGNAHLSENKMSEKVYEFTFMVVQNGETKQEALAAALEYLVEMASKGELEPVNTNRIE